MSYKVSEILFLLKSSELWVSDFPHVPLFVYLHNAISPMPAATPIVNIESATFTPISVLTIIKFSPYGFLSKSAIRVGLILTL